MAFQRSGTSYHGDIEMQQPQVPAWDNSKEIFTSKLSIFSSSPSPIRQNLRMTKNATEVPPNNNSHCCILSSFAQQKNPQKTEAGDVWPIQPPGGSWSWGKWLPAWDPYVSIVQRQAKLHASMADVSYKIDGCAYIMYLWHICVCIYYITSIVFCHTACYAVTMIWKLQRWNVVIFPLLVILWSSGSRGNL